MRRALLAVASGAIAATACGEIIGATPDDPPEPSSDAAATPPGSDATSDGPSATGDGGGDAAASDRPKLVFVTTGLTPGDMTFLGAQSKPGPTGADSQCQAEAAAAGRTGTFVAWLSTTSRSPAALLDDGSWELVDHTPIFASRAAITSSSPLHPINKTAQNKPPVNDAVPQVWTGTQANGTLAFASCTDWTDKTTAGTGSTGLYTANTTNWTASSQDSCDALLPVYCFQAR